VHVPGIAFESGKVDGHKFFLSRRVVR